MRKFLLLLAALLPLAACKAYQDPYMSQESFGVRMNVNGDKLLMLNDLMVVYTTSEENACTFSFQGNFYASVGSYRDSRKLVLKLSDTAPIVSGKKYTLEGGSAQLDEDASLNGWILFNSFDLEAKTLEASFELTSATNTIKHGFMRVKFSKN